MDVAAVVSRALGRHFAKSDHLASVPSRWSRSSRHGIEATLNDFKTRILGA